MSFFDSRLPERFSFGARGGPMFSTEVVRTVGGQRFANKNWIFPLHRYDVSHGVKNTEDFEVIRAFFYNVAGQFDGFRFKDWADYQANGQPLTAISEGVTYQMARAYVRGSRTFNRAIYKPVVGTATIVRDRSGTLSTPATSIDYSTGIVTISNSHITGDVYTWSGEFDVPVAFTSDMLEAVIENRNHSEGFLITWPSIQVQEIRL